jgi:hypothetical protein
VIFFHRTGHLAEPAHKIPGSEDPDYKADHLRVVGRFGRRAGSGNTTIPRRRTPLGTPISRLAFSQAPFRRMAFPGSGCGTDRQIKRGCATRRTGPLPTRGKS